MTAAEALRAAHASGVRVKVEGESLLLEAIGPPPTGVLNTLAQHKAGILALLRPGRDGWTAENWRTFFYKRAHLAEFDGGSSQAEAMAKAFDYCVTEWLNRNPARSAYGHCLGCGHEGSAGNLLLPFGIDPGSHAWLHGGCWNAWRLAREAEAIAALSFMGIRA